MTPTPSDVLPTAPARRWRPAEPQKPTTTSTATRAPLPRSRRLFCIQMTITSHHNSKLKEIRKLNQRRRWRERSGRFVAEGEDLLAAADAAGWTAVERYCAAGSGLPGTEVEQSVLASASGLGSGTRTLAVYEERWAPAAVGPLCVYLHGLSRPRQRRRRAAQRAGVRRRVGGARPGHRGPVQPEGGASQHGRGVRRPARARKRGRRSPRPHGRAGRRPAAGHCASSISAR